MSVSPMGYSADYMHLEEALRSRWMPYKELINEIAEFSPQVRSDFDETSTAMLAHLKKLNPESTVDELQAIVDQQISFRADPSTQYYFRFHNRIMVEHVTVLMLSHALCEALINVLLAVGLAEQAKPEAFSLLDKSDVKKKWRLGPKLLSENYSFPKSNALYESLVMLTRQRNGFVHYKAEVEMNGKKVIEGSNIERMPINQQLKWMHRFFSLPYDLIEFVGKNTNHTAALISVLMRRVDKAPEHRNT